MFMSNQASEQSSNLSCKLEKNPNSSLLGNPTVYYLQEWLEVSLAIFQQIHSGDDLMYVENELEILGLLGILDSYTCSWKGWANSQIFKDSKLTIENTHSLTISGNSLWGDQCNANCFWKVYSWLGYVRCQPNIPRVCIKAD